MNARKQTIWVLAGTFLAAVILTAATPAQGRDKKSPREHSARSSHSHHGKSHSHHHGVHSRQRSAGSQVARQIKRSLRIGSGLAVGVGARTARIRPSVVYSSGHYVVPSVTYSPGHYETRTERVLVSAGHYEWQQQRVLVEAGHYETRYVNRVTEIVYDSRGNPHEVVVQAGRVEKVWIPDRYETRKVKVWVPPVYETRTVRVWVSGSTISTGVRYGYSSGGLNVLARIKF